MLEEIKKNFVPNTVIIHQ